MHGQTATTDSVLQGKKKRKFKRKGKKNTEKDFRTHSNVPTLDERNLCKRPGTPAVGKWSACTLVVWREFSPVLAGSLTFMKNLRFWF